MLQAIKEILTPKRAPAVPEPLPIEAAQHKLEGARAELQRIETEQAAVCLLERDRFEADASEQNAGTLAHAENRATILVDHARRKVFEAEAVLAESEREVREAKLAALAAIEDGLRDRLKELAGEAAPHLQAFLAVLDRRDPLVRAAHDAHIEAARLRGESRHERSTFVPQIHEGRFSIELESVLGKAERIRLQNYFGG